MADLEGYGPRLPATPTERRVSALALVGLLGLFAAEVVSSPANAKVAVLAFFLAWAPLLVLHELGHALAAVSVGWRVSEITLGFGRELWRFSVAGTLVRIKFLPVEGYVRPSPRTPGWVRWKSAWIYLWGPGAELLAGAGLFLASDGRLFQQTEFVPVIALQGVAAAIGVSLFFNLLPLPLGGRVNDGLGIITSLLASREAFASHLVAPFLLGAKRSLLAENPVAAEQLLSVALAEYPGDPCLRAWRAVCLAERGDPRLAEDLLRRTGEPAKHDPALAAELYAALAWAWLISDDSGVLVFAAQAARRATEFDPGDLHHWLLEARIAYARGRMCEAFRRAMDAYRAASELEDEGPCLATLAMASHRLLNAGDLGDPEVAPVLIRPDYPRRFQSALQWTPIGPRLRRQVEELLTPTAGA
ncbi:MAG TPA: site-2 protease family protein [Verrucomicrobiales bacterium]|nr:site-2 protease family protein [Verrucomicrobiales bacterium]